MNHTPDSITAADNGDTFDPQQAAALLDQTTQQTQRELEPYPPWMSSIRAVAALAACGAVWLEVRGQHPYLGPTAAVTVPVIATFVLINFAATMAVAKRATIGVGGKSRLRPAEITVMAVAWVGVYVVMGVMAGTGVSHAITYGTYGTSASLIVPGLVWAIIMAARRNWRRCGPGLAVAAIGAIAILGGPVGSWAVVGIGLFILLLGTATVRVWQQRRSAVRP
jgi:hypothetical protein